ncbi:putative glycerol kinase 5 isoform X5 [Columba livia]|uniref:putative glycerol kinase 5 isoform X5 n=1 Tax=Columba livia TaxID=8932 RepID=UPI0031BAB98E
MPCEQQESGVPPARYVVGVDVGSTVVKCHVYDRAAAVRGSSCRKVESIYPRPGWVELDPEVLWSQFVGVIKEAVQVAGLHMRQIAGLGISTQRGTFITWHKRTGKPFHNFISWQDSRSAELVNSWNKSLLLKVVHVIFTILHFLTGNDRYLAPSFLTFSTQQASMKLSWVFKNIYEAEEAAKKNNCCFGTIDTWLLYRLTKGSVYATDCSNASATGIFEPYTKCWSPTLCSLLSIPTSIYPSVKDTSFNFGSADSEIFGVPIPIMAMVSVNDPYLCASFMGLKPSTTRNHLVRAILESVAFRNKQLYDIIVKDVRIPLQNIRADGGVSNNSFVMQMTSDLINKKIEKPANADMSSLGAAFLAGLASGFWSDKEQLKKLRRIEAVFEPQKDSEEYKPAMDTWLQAMKRSLRW